MTNSSNKIKILPEERYKYLTKQLRYLDDKIFRAYALFVTIATAVIGGTVYLYSQKTHIFTLRKPEDFGLVIDLTFLGICFGSNLVILNNLRAWWDHRKKLESYEEVPRLKGPWWWVNEIFGCIGIVIVGGAFLYFNPFRPLSLYWSLGLPFICFTLGSMPLIPVICEVVCKCEEKKRE